MGAKNEVAAKLETGALPSNPEEKESEGMKELATKEGAGKPKAGLTPSEQDELEKASTEEDNELGAKNEVKAKLETGALP